MCFSNTQPAALALQSSRFRALPVRSMMRSPGCNAAGGMRNSEAVRELAGWGCLTQMHVVRLLAPRIENEDHTKDVDFSPSGIRKRWGAGYTSARNALMQTPWLGEFDPLEGVILHEPHIDMKIVQIDGNPNPVARSKPEMREPSPRVHAG